VVTIYDTSNVIYQVKRFVLLNYYFPKYL